MPSIQEFDAINVRSNRRTVSRVREKIFQSCWDAALALGMAIFVNKINALRWCLAHLFEADQLHEAPSGLVSVQKSTHLQCNQWRVLIRSINPDAPDHSPAMTPT
jgi:hypothetical protein